MLRQKLLVLILPCLFALCTSFGVAAENDPATVPSAVPDPFALSADWWRFVAARAAEERASAIDELLKSVKNTATRMATDETTAALVEEISASANAYVAQLATPSPSPASAEPAKKSYTFDEVLDLHARKKETALELKLAREQVQRKTRSQPQLEKRLSTKKADYLALPENSEKRLSDGLTIIADRLRLSVQEERLRIEKAQLVNWETDIGHIDEELALALTRLQIDEKMIEEARTSASKFRALQDNANIALRKLEATALETSTDDAPQAAALRTIELIAAQARALESETVATRYDLQGGYLQARLHPEPANFEKLHQIRSHVGDFVTDMRESIGVWREAAAVERTRALKLLSNEHDDAATVSDPIAEQRIKVANEVSRITAQIDASTARVEFIEKHASAFLAHETGRFRDWLIRATDFAQTAWGNVRYWASSSLFEINETPVTLIGLLRIIIILMIAIWVSKLVRHGLERLAERNPSVNRSSVYMLGRMFHYVILATAFLVALSSIGLDFTKLAFIAGAVGVGIGFGLQAIFSNFISGIIVLFERSLKVGDFVELESGVTGEVREINIRSTLITTNDNIDILVPNSEFVNGRVTNWTLRDAHRRTHIPFGVAYGSDKELVKKAALEAAEEVPFTLKNYPGRDPKVWLVEFGDSSLNFELVVWLTRDAVVRPGAVHSAYSWAIETALGKYDLEIPFPQRDINVRSFFGRRDESGLDWFDDVVEKKPT